MKGGTNTRGRQGWERGGQARMARSSLPPLATAYRSPPYGGLPVVKKHIKPSGLSVGVSWAWAVVRWRGESAVARREGGGAKGEWGAKGHGRRGRGARA